ncbi:MAG TPA: enterotoxin, partial [Rhodanobacteraceae bacterium]|nr:enterotoxin [Rhodanobacteraceae bacterium]
MNTHATGARRHNDRPARALYGRLLTFAAIACVALPGMGQAASANRIGNAAVQAEWQVDQGKLTSLAVHDTLNQQRIEVTTPFALVLADGSRLDSSNLRLLKAPALSTLAAEPDASRLAVRSPGQVVAARFGDAAGRVQLDWKLVQREGAQYLREIVTITALKAALPIQRVELFGLKAPAAIVEGSVDGSPVVAGNEWFGFEHPMAKSEAWSGRVRLWLPRSLPLAKGQSVSYSAV